MSRIGKLPINIPKSVELKVDGRSIRAKGPKGELAIVIPEPISFNIENNILTFSRASDDKKVRALHGLSRSLTNNIIEGVQNGFSKTLKIEGVGYKVELKGVGLLLSLGYSHQIYFLPPEGIQFEVQGTNTINVKGIDKQQVGLVASKIRRLRPPEPYKGKGIHYEGEYIIRKEGKKTSK
ncbi:MAG TPA: 50S ribosomal protein L6 [Candidatus Kapabacteria bacterium]|jgi:large subunit ribosomal protein L6|nr:50S ribosomal protein L6 [Candidatus Kapabacteria bacterium]HOV92170.1 50S ribosomal protein L6 [Candidatus Kapabacteria bacterium]